MNPMAWFRLKKQGGEIDVASAVCEVKIEFAGRIEREDELFTDCPKISEIRYSNKLGMSSAKLSSLSCVELVWVELSWVEAGVKN